MGAVNDAMIWLAENFTGLFNAAGQQFASFITSMIPMLVCLILTIKALIALIGEERILRCRCVHDAPHHGTFPPC